MQAGNSFYEKYIKRVIDVSLCSLSVVILSPVFAATAIGIKASSPGPVFYYSERAGKDKKPFMFYKFRSMHVTDNDKHMFVADADRLFAFGKIIRRLKIDELPQLINVIKGDMSIVGPRPMTTRAIEYHYSGKYEPVSKVRPGLTSAASLYDYVVGDTYTDNKEYQAEVVPIKHELELYYVQHQSFSYDAELVLRTIVTIIQVVLGKKSFRPIRELSSIQFDVDTGDRECQ